MNNRKEVSDLASGATLEIPGFAAASWDDLYKDDRIELTLDGSDKVTAIKVVGRNITTVGGATIVNLSNDTLTFKDQNGKPAAVTLNSKTRIEMNNSYLSLDAARMFFVAGRKVTITYSEDQAITIRFAYRHTGTLQSLNTAGSSIVLKLDDGSTVTIRTRRRRSRSPARRARRSRISNPATGSPYSLIRISTRHLPFWRTASCR